jgi:hypothetical protein
MKTSIYQLCKIQLKGEAADAKKAFKSDKPAQRQIINDHADSLQRNPLNQAMLNEVISKKQFHQYCNWLSLYACKLHPKN